MVVVLEFGGFCADSTGQTYLQEDTDVQLSLNFVSGIAVLNFKHMHPQMINGALEVIMNFFISEGVPET